MNHDICLWISPRLPRTFKPECVGNVQAVPCRPGPSPACIANTAKPFAVGELSLLISETGAGKDEEYFIKIYFTGFLFALCTSNI